MDEQQYSLFTDADFEAPITPFTDRVVCIMGSFRQTYRALRQRVMEMGATDMRNAATRNVHIVLLGSHPTEAQLEGLRALNFNGFEPKVLRQEDVDQVLGGFYHPYMVPKKIRKSLHLTYQHFCQAAISYDGDMNPLYTKELYVAQGTAVPFEELLLMMGNNGIYGNVTIDDTTDVLLIPDATIQHLREGVSDDVVRYIEETYNKSSAQSFRLQMTSESDFLQWLQSRHKA